ncbi:MAG TPA: hypothetical protein VKF15_02025, partial [Nitrososphaerales archaeon]|nr:hypothetical protein [Nitrososphaerales archaeon]
MAVAPRLGPSRGLVILLIFTLLSGFFVVPIPTSVKAASPQSSSSLPSRHTATPPWILSLLGGNSSDNLPGPTSGATPMALTLNHTVDIRGQDSGNGIYYSPNEIRSAYNVTSLLTSGYDGTGMTISIVDAFGDPYIQSELNSFSSAFGIPSTKVNVICVDGPCYYYLGVSTGWNGEIALDVEWAHAIAP